MVLAFDLAKHLWARLMKSTDGYAPGRRMMATGPRMLWYEHEEKGAATSEVFVNF